MRCVCVTLLTLALASSPLDAQQTDRKASERRAKTIASEAKKLEKQKQFAAARTRYVDAQGIFSTKDARTGLMRVDRELKKQTRKFVETAEKEYKAGRSEQALKLLGDAENTLPGHPDVLVNTAMVLLKLGRQKDALQRLDAAAASIGDANQHRQILEMRSSLTVNASGKLSDSSLKERLEDLNERMEDSANFETVCQDLATLRQTRLKDDPTLILNLARCAENEGRLDEANQLFEAYLKAAPDAVDGDDVKRNAQELASLASLEGEAGERVRAAYSDAAQLLRRGLYREALDTYEKARTAAPDHPETAWRLASLHQALGNTADATAHYERYLAIETNRAKQTSARAELDNLLARQRDYDQTTGDVDKRLSEMFFRAFVSGETLSPDFGQRELSETSALVQDSLALMPLGLKANALAAMIYLSSGNYEAARQSYLAVRDKGSPVVFFARFRLEGKSDLDVLGKAELTTEETLTIIPTATWEKKRKRWTVVEDARTILAGYSERQPRSTSDHRVVINLASVKSIETPNHWIELEHRDGKVWIQPQYLTGVVPPTGPLSRKNANVYAKVLRDFLPYKDAKLGKESMTGGEKFAMAASMAAAAYSAYNMATLSSVAGNVAQRSRAIAKAIQAASEAFQQALVRQRQLLHASQVSQFRLMPTETYEPKFRAELLR